jgi:hypothetical protein
VTLVFQIQYGQGCLEPGHQNPNRDLGSELTWAVKVLLMHGKNLSVIVVKLAGMESRCLKG